MTHLVMDAPTTATLPRKRATWPMSGGEIVRFGRTKVSELNVNTLPDYHAELVKPRVREYTAGHYQREFREFAKREVGRILASALRVQITMQSDSAVDTETIDQHVAFAHALADFTANDQIEPGGVALYRHLTSVLRDRDFQGCNLLLQNTSVENTDLTLLLALLMGTSRMPREHLKARGELYRKVKERFISEHGRDEAQDALESLE